MAQSPGDKALAEGLFREGRELMKEDKTAEACGKFQESNRLDPTLGTLLNVAVCHEKLGRTASAWAEFNEALRLAERRGESERAAIAGERVKALEAKLSRVTIVARQPTPGLEVRAGGQVIGEAVLGSALPFDPGELRIVVSAKGHEDWTTTVTVPKGPVPARAVRGRSSRARVGQGRRGLPRRRWSREANRGAGAGSRSRGAPGLLVGVRGAATTTLAVGAGAPRARERCLRAEPVPFPHALKGWERERSSGRRHG